MATGIKDLAKDLSKEDLLDDFVGVGTALGVPAETFTDGDPMYGLLQILSERFADLWNGVIVRAIRAGFLDFAEGAWLTLRTALDYETPRKEASFAGSKLWVENRGGDFYTLNPGDVRVQNESHKTFVNVTGGTLTAWGGVGAYPKVLLDFVADEAGSASSTLAGGIDTTPVLAPANVFVQTNASPILGQDEEEDDELVTRARLSTGPLSPAGPQSAYEYIALSAKRSDGTSVDVTRVRVIDAGNDVIKVFLAGASGPTLGDMATPDTDVFIVFAELLRAVMPVGFRIEVYGATVKEVSFAISLTVDRKSLLTTAEAELAATTAINDFFRTLKIGGHRTSEGGSGYVFASEVEAKASEAARGIVRARADAGSDLEADVELQPQEVAVPVFSVSATLVSQ